MSIEIDDDPRVAMFVPPMLLSKYRKAGINLEKAYGMELTMGKITSYTSYLYFREALGRLRGNRE